MKLFAPVLRLIIQSAGMVDFLFYKGKGCINNMEEQNMKKAVSAMLIFALCVTALCAWRSGTGSGHIVSHSHRGRVATGMRWPQGSGGHGGAPCGGAWSGAHAGNHGSGEHPGAGRQRLDGGAGRDPGFLLPRHGGLFPDGGRHGRTDDGLVPAKRWGGPGGTKYNGARRGQLRDGLWGQAGGYLHHGGGTVWFLRQSADGHVRLFAPAVALSDAGCG